MSDSENKPENCPECGGDVDTEVVNDDNRWVCQDCGFVVDKRGIAEEQQDKGIPDDAEVMQ